MKMSQTLIPPLPAVSSPPSAYVTSPLVLDRCANPATASAATAATTVPADSSLVLFGAGMSGTGRTVRSPDLMIGRIPRARRPTGARSFPGGRVVGEVVAVQGDHAEDVAAGSAEDAALEPAVD